jgi:hypothetical protein
MPWQYGGEIPYISSCASLIPRCYSSEGVQLGNVASALGVVGTWSGGGRRPGMWFQSININRLLNAPDLGVPVGKLQLVTLTSLLVTYHILSRSILDVEGPG